MAYTITDRDGRSWVRLINLQAGPRPRVMKPFNTAWTCDPCAPSRERYSIDTPAGRREYAWYEIITNADDAQTRAAKYRHAAAVIRAAQELATAEHAYRRLIA